MADSQIASRKAVVRSRLGTDFCAIQFPPKKNEENEQLHKQIKYCSVQTGEMETFQTAQSVHLIVWKQKEIKGG